MSKNDFESNKPKIEAAIGNSFTNTPSSWRSEKSITSWLKEYEIPYSGGFDVRNITKYLRDNGSSMFALGIDVDTRDLKEILSKAKNILGDSSAMTAGNQNNENTPTEGKIGIIDLGAKRSIIKVLEDHDYKVVMISPSTTSNEILKMNLKGLLISNGPGDPRSLLTVIDTVQNLIGKLPIFGICLGHQILALACGLKVKKMQFGHHGSNHPVEIEGIKKALITAQNHGFSIEEFEDGFEHENFGNISVFARNLNDGTNEGISLWDSMAYSVQFHPESGPGTTDGLQIFNPFFEMIENNYAKK
jgi:carbamoyl-phosphate synthase small subunit